MVVTEADVQEALVVADPRCEVTRQPIVDTAGIQVEYFQGLTKRKVVGCVLRRYPVLEVLGKSKNVLVKDELLYFLLLVYLPEYGLETRERNADFREVELTNVGNIVFQLLLLLLDRLADPASDLGHDLVGFRRAEDRHQLLDPSVTEIVVT